MKKFIYHKLFLCGVALVFVFLSHITAQAQIGGVPVWTNRYSGPVNDNDGAEALAVDGSGNVFVTGYSTAAGGSNPAYATIKYSGAGVALWTNRYSAITNSYRHDEPQAMAVDGSGSVIVTGLSAFGDIGYDYATVKYSGAGVALWTNRYNGPGNHTDVANAIAVDGSGNVFVTGYSVTTSSTYTPAYATLKYSGAGVPLWTNRYTGPGNYDSANAIAVDGSGNVFVTGYSYGSGGANPDYVTIKYSGAGVASWTNRYNGNGDDYALALAVDGSGNVIVTGQSTGNGGNYDYATLKYSGAGVALWTNRYNGPGNDRDLANAIAADRSGNVFVTGYSYGIGSSYDYATIAYSGAGVALWTNRYSGPANYDVAHAIAVDGSGNVFVTGHSRGFGGTIDYATIMYSSAIPPSLTVARTLTNTVVVSWPSPSTDLRLQFTTNLVSPVIWNTNLPSPVVINGKNTVTNLISGTRQFFRLSQ